MKIFAFFLNLAIFLIFAAFIFPSVAQAEELKPQLTWQRSTEAEDKVVEETILGSKINEALALPLDTNQVVFDNGVDTPQVNKDAVASGITWSSWIQYSSIAPGTCGPTYELRHFQAKFNLPSNFAQMSVQEVKLKSPYYPEDTFPINDNAYIYFNGNFISRLGTSYGATNLGFRGSAPYANETDGWIADGNLGAVAAQYLHSGENTLDLVTGETCWWGGVGELELEIIGDFSLQVPYFSQVDPQWGGNVYDHADDSGQDLDCEEFGGPFIASCGCALTSAAMILKYHHVDRGPTGDITDPAMLNNWLADSSNKGYLYGNIDWFAVARYSKISHDVFNSPIIDYVLPNLGENFSVLDDDLANERPVILRVPNHFIVATGISGSTYSINDPRWDDRLTLEAYGGHFQEMRRFTKTNSDLSGILIATHAPAEFLIIDQEGKRSGRDPSSGEIFNEIPNATYHLETPLVDDTYEDTIAPPDGNGIFLFEMTDPQSGTYTVIKHSNSGEITFRGYDHDGKVSEQVLNQRGFQEYQLHYSSQPGAQIEIAKNVNIDIEPKDHGNVIKSTKQGILEVALLTTPGFNALDVDAQSVRLGPAQAKPLLRKGIRMDVDHDGDKDLLFLFKVKDIGLKRSDSQLCLTGQTKDGIAFEGCDEIKISSKGHLNFPGRGFLSELFWKGRLFFGK